MDFTYLKWMALIFFFAIGAAHANDVHDADSELKPIEACMVAAKLFLAIPTLDYPMLKNKCECVKAKGNGDLPATVLSWKMPQNASMVEALYECAEGEITGNISGETLKTEMESLQRAGVAIQDEDIQNIEDYSFCVGGEFYKKFYTRTPNSASVVNLRDTPQFIVENIMSKCDAGVKNGKRTIHICMGNVNDKFERFGFDTETVAEICSCVRSRENGKLPLDNSAWTGKNSPISSLMACAEGPVTRYFETSTYEKTRAKAYSTQKARQFSACVATHTYKVLSNEMIITHKSNGRAQTKPNILSEKYLSIYKLCDPALR